MLRPRSLRRAALALLALAACSPAVPDAALSPPPPAALSAEAPPTGRLPTDVRPLRYHLELTVDPARPRFDGTVDVEVELGRARDVIWMHGRDLAVTRAAVQPVGGAAVEARWEQAAKGLGALRLSTPVGPGKAVIRLAWSAAFAEADEGFGVHERGGARYAATQGEPIFARRVFPCFDEPSWKTPYETVLHVPAGLVAVSNTREVSRTAEAIPDPASPSTPLRYERVAFAVTEKLPSYLVAFAVGPFDVVEAPAVPPNAVRSTPLPLRGLAARGRGKDLAYTLAHTGALVAELERTFGSAYPYDKLDLIAVPDKVGAMENPGALTFDEGILLFDGPPSVEQRLNFTLVAAHELSHQWFGDLVTMPWWNDLWLKEGFAAWAEGRIVAAVMPELPVEVDELRDFHVVMGMDSRLAARKVRQEVETEDDLASAYDGITYGKGAAVIGMFERWLGRAAFRDGLRAHFAAHRHGHAGVSDLLEALSKAGARDVATPFRTFLDQPGLPNIEARLSCEGTPTLALRQTRYLPLGSTGDENKSWQVPVCARYADGKEIREACTLLTGPTGSLPLPASGCPAWVMPNADGTGYYRWSLAPEDTKKLAAALPSLSVRERLSYADSVRASFTRGKLPAEEALAALAPLAGDPNGYVAGAPMALIGELDGWLHGDPRREALRAKARAMHAGVVEALGWTAKAGEAADRAVLRAELLAFVALGLRDPKVLREAAARGRAWLDGKVDAVEPDLLPVALPAAMLEGDAALFERLSARLAKEEHPNARHALLRALGHAQRPDQAARARALTIDPAVRLGPLEILVPLTAQLQQAELSAEAWAFTQKNADALIARLPERRKRWLVGMPAPTCDARRAEEITALFQPRLGAITGGPRALTDAVEKITLCAARRAALGPGLRASLEKKPKR